MPGYNSETRGRFCDGLGSNIVVQHSVGPIITLHGQITAREYVDRLDNQMQNTPTGKGSDLVNWYKYHQHTVIHYIDPDDEDRRNL
jgi:hypothetical protein